MEVPFYNFEFTGDVQEKTLPPGEYLLECWGARGGGVEEFFDLELSASGKGGYSRGLIKLEHETKLYIHVGGRGKTVKGILLGIFVEGGYNGGGSCFATRVDPTGAGGGGTDIRIETDSIFARVIVAGGGGGSGGSDKLPGAPGGGLIGGFGIPILVSPGGQTSEKESEFGEGGEFFQGAHTDMVVGGAGGGWYGASALQPKKSSEIGANSGSGGSGYVYTEGTAVNYPEGCLLNESYYLKSAETIGGDQEFLGPDGRYEVGHNGDGYVRITKSRFQFLDLDNETCALKSHERTYCIENITIPNEYADLKVISILAYAFSGNPCIKRVFIPNTIITIHRYAFYYCENLKTVEFEANSSLTYIGLSSFSMSGITNITIPENISIIESSAFALCKNLTNVTTCSRRYLNTANAFENCDKLTDIFVSPYYEGDEFCGIKVTHKSDCCSCVPKLRCISQTRRDYCQRKLNVAPANIMLLRLL